MRKYLVSAALMLSLMTLSASHAQSATSYGVSITEAATQPGNGQYVVHRPSVFDIDLVSLAACNAEVSAVAALWQSEVSVLGLISPFATGGVCSGKAQATTNVSTGVLFVDFYVPQLGWQLSLTQSVNKAKCASLLANNASVVVSAMGSTLPSAAGQIQSGPTYVSYPAYAESFLGTVFIGCTGF